jgi:hypothetical protein
MPLINGQTLVELLRTAGADSSMRPATHATLYSCDTLFERLPQTFEHVACELRPRIEAQEAMRRQWHLSWNGDLAPTDQADI